MCVDGKLHQNPRIQANYAAAGAWDDFAPPVSLALDLYQHMTAGTGAFEKEDDSAEQRLCTIVNHVKHLNPGYTAVRPTGAAK